MNFPPSGKFWLDILMASYGKYVDRVRRGDTDGFVFHCGTLTSCPPKLSKIS